MIVQPEPLMTPTLWAGFPTLTCSVLPVRMACNLSCSFCFSKSSVSSIAQESVTWTPDLLRRYYQLARARGAKRLVVTGGGEPLLRPEAVLESVRIGREFFDEIALFTNAILLSTDLARELSVAGLSYVCWSRHHHEDRRNRDLMGAAAPPLLEIIERIGSILKLRATCVMCHGFIATSADALDYVRALRAQGVKEFTFKHTYTAYPGSVFADSQQNAWAQAHQVQEDPFAGEGSVIARLPWGPEIKRIGDIQLCYYHEPTPNWEQQHQLARSWNLLADGSVYASLEDKQSLLCRLKP